MKQRYSFLLSPTWLGWLAGCLVFFAVCYLLGQWQIDRREAALEEISTIVQNYDQDPVPYHQAREVFAEGSAADEWRVITLQGEYLLDDSLLVRNRGHGGQVGYEQLVPFRDGTTGDVVVVSRGWLPSSSDDASTPAYNPEPPHGQVEVVARMRPAEPAIDRDAPDGQLASIDTAEYESVTGYEMVQGAYARMAEESPAPAEAPQQLTRPSVDEGPHLGYSMQWIAFGLLSFVGWGYAARVHRRNLDAEAIEELEGSQAAEDEELSPADARLEKKLRLQQAKQLRRRQNGKFSDEDIEDAWVDQRLTNSR